MRNFNVPYFSRDIAEFWRRWHISLTTWFRDYVYIPLGGSRVSKAKVVRNTFIIFLLSGFWHGANWTFIAWGAYHAVLFLPLILTGKNRKYTNQVAEGRLLPTIKETGQMLLTFFFAVFGWIIFRAESVGMAWEYFQGMLQFGTLRASYRFFFLSGMWPGHLPIMWPTNLFIVIMLVVEWLQRGKEYGVDLKKNTSKIIRWILCLVIALVILSFAPNSIGTFIYFQF